MPKEAQQLIFGKEHWRVAHAFHLMKYQLPLVLYGYLKYDGLKDLVEAIQRQREVLKIPKESLGKKGEIQNPWNDNLANLIYKERNVTTHIESYQIKNIVNLVNPNARKPSGSFNDSRYYLFDFISPILRDMIRFMDDDFNKKSYQTLSYHSNYNNRRFLINLFKQEKDASKRADILLGLSTYQESEVHYLLLEHYRNNKAVITPDEFHYVLKNLMNIRAKEIESMAWHGLSTVHFLISNLAYNYLLLTCKISNKKIVFHLLSQLKDEKKSANFHIHLSQLRSNYYGLPAASEILKIYLLGWQLPERIDIQNTTVKILQSLNGLPFPIDFSKKGTFSEEDKLGFLSLTQVFYQDKESEDVFSRIFTHFLKSALKEDSEAVRRKTMEVIGQLSISRKSTVILEMLRVNKDDYAAKTLGNSMVTIGRSSQFGLFNENIVYFFKKCLNHSNQNIQNIAFETLRNSPDFKVLQKLAKIPKGDNAQLNAKVLLLKENLEKTYQTNQGRKKLNVPKPNPSRLPKTQNAWKSQKPILSDTTLYAILKFILWILLCLFLSTVT